MDKIGTVEKKLHFVELRAAGQSYRNIAAELHISKDTARRWNHELADEIKQFQSEQITELVNAYKMDKAARVRRLGETIKKMDAAVAKIDYKQIDPAKLLQLRLTYMNSFQAESGEGVARNCDVATMTRAEVDDLTAKAKTGTATVEDAELAAAATERFSNADKAIKKAVLDRMVMFE